MKDTHDINTQNVYDNYEKGWNGRMEQTDLPEIQQKITYPHPNKPGETTSQNYVEYNDLAVVVFIRKNDKGVFEFGLIEKEAPAFIPSPENEDCPKDYTGIFLEALTFAFPDKSTLPDDIDMWIDDQILSIGLDMQGFSNLDDSKTAIAQSFTNQSARFYVAGINETNSNNHSEIHWFPISSLESYLDMQRAGGKDGIHSSIQTLYPLELLRNKYLSQIREMQSSEFQLDKPLSQLKLVEKAKTNPSYRFSIWEASYINANHPENLKTATYLTSRSNAANSILITENGENMFLSPQKRSPFMTVNEDLKLEVAGGLTEGKSYKNTALAELSEEQGFDAKNVKEFTGPLAATPLNSELSQAFITHYEDGSEGIQHLDEQESIGKKIPKSFKDLKENLHNRQIPLTTKYYIMLRARDMEKEKIKTDEDLEK